MSDVVRLATIPNAAGIECTLQRAEQLHFFAEARAHRTRGNDGRWEVDLLGHEVEVVKLDGSTFRGRVVGVERNAWGADGVVLVQPIKGT